MFAKKRLQALAQAIRPLTESFARSWQERKSANRRIGDLRFVTEALETRVYLSGLTAGASSRIQAVQFQTFDAGVITDSTKGGSIYVPAGASVAVAGIQDASLTIAGKLAITSAQSVVNSLAISGGTLDLTSSKLFINYGSGSDPNSTIRGYLTSGYNGSSWNGAGIDSSTAAQSVSPKYSVGYADGADGIVSGLTSGQLEVAYTLAGDVNLDGVVNGSDFGLLAAHFGKTVTNWDQGDLNYDGVVNGSDFGLLAATFGKSANRGGNNYTSPEQYVASFTDTAGIALTNLTATINWGDGTASSTGAIVADAGTASGTYHVIANHDYLEAGTYNISTSVHDAVANTTVSIPGTVVVSPSVFASISKPVGLTATPLDANQMEVTWADVPLLNAIGNTGLELDVSTTASFTTFSIQSLLSHVTASVVSGLTANTLYYFRIRAAGVSAAPYSETATATTKTSGSPAAPTIATGASGTLNTSQTAVTLSMTATAPGSDSLAYSWQTVSSPLGVTTPTFSYSGSEQTSTATPFGSGTYVFRGVATDSSMSSASNGLAVTSDVVVIVSQVTSNVNVTVNNINVAPGIAGVADGDSRQFTATTIDQFGIAMATQPSSFSWNLSPGARPGERISTSGLYHAPTSAGIGSVTIQATASGFTGTATAYTAPVGTSGPTVFIQSVSGSINQLTPVSIVADSPNDTLSSYTLTLTPLSGGSAITLASGTTEVGAAPSNAVPIATINPDLLQQGYYTLSLSATDAGGTSPPVSQTVQITSQLKLGNFHLPVTDLALNTPGIPLTVSRVYDSTMANENRGDFGPGWRLELPDVNFTSTVFPHGNYEFQNHPGYFVGDAFYITLPGGAEDTFVFHPTDTGNFTGDGEVFQPNFDPVNGTHDHLTVNLTYDNQFSDQDSYNGQQIDLLENGNEVYVNAGGIDGFVDYNPAIETGNSNSTDPSFGNTLVLTTQQGITYTINATTLKVMSEHDLNGNTITYSSNAITYTSNTAGATPTTITIHRNSPSGNIDYILDPNGGKISYGYNANGDLISVTQRDNESNGTRDVTSYSYQGNTNLMTIVTDGRGANLFTATYGPNGGLSSLADVYGNPVPIQIAPSGSDNSVETTADLLGNTKVEIYNNNGQLLSTIKQLRDPQNPAVTRFSVTVDQYNNSLSSLITLQSNPFFTDAANQFTAGATATETSPPPNGWQTDQTYDGNGNLSTSKDDAFATNNTTSYASYITYNDPNGNAVEILGRPQTITDPSGAVTTNAYDGSGNLQTTTDGTGQETKFDHNSAGEVTNTYREFPINSGTLQILSTNAYNSLAQLSSTTDFNYLPNGTQSGNVVHNYLYDNNGNQTLSYYYNATNNQTVVDRTNYDGDDRQIEARHYVPAGNLSFTSAANFDSHSYTPLTTTSTTYNADGKTSTATDEYGGVTYYDYDVKGNLIRTVYPDQTEVRSVYDVVGRLLVQTDRYYTGATSLASPNNTLTARATLYVYDGTGRVEETDRVDGVVVTIGQDPSAPTGINTGAWNGQGSLVSRSETIYNSSGQAAAVVGTDGQTTGYTYLTDGKVATQTDALGDKTSYVYTVNTGGSDTTSTAVTDPNLHTTTTTYDADGRVIQVSYDDGSFTQTTYTQTPTGQTVAQFRERNTGDTPIETDSKYDLNGRLVEVDEPNPTTPTSSSGKLVTTYGYDIYGDETSQTDANNHTTTFTYDSEGRQTGRTLPGGTLTESTIYDGFGRESQHTDFNGNVTVFDYNNTGQFEGTLADQKYFTPGQSLGSTPNEETAYLYTNLGQQQQVTQYSAGTIVRTTTYTYDLDGNETSQVATIPGSSTTQQLYHVYDQATDRLIETYTGNSSSASATTDTHYGYDALGRLASVTSFKIDAATPATAQVGSTLMYSASGATTTTTLPNIVYTYDPAGNLHTVALPNGMVQTYTYNDLNRLTNEAVTEGANSIETFSYPSYTADGQRKTEVDSVYNTSGTLLYTNTFTWGYDGDNRLGSETLVAGTGSPDQSYTDAYTYDSVGNRLTKVHTVGSNVTTITDSYDTNGDDRLMTETATGTGAYSTTYTYDNNGSMKSETRTGTGATTNTYIYDVQNHLTSATIGGTTTTYAYDASGKRVSSTQGASTTYYTIDDINPTGYTQVIEQAATLGGTPVTSYVIGQAVLGQANSSAVLSYLMTDGHGSTRILATATGGITSRYDFDAFGNALTATTGTQILYSGQFLDSATGLYDLRARNYDPTTGRFTGVDPYAGSPNDPLSLVRFLYAGDNPVDNVDPTGRQFGDIVLAIGEAGALDAVVGVSAAPAIAAAETTAGIASAEAAAEAGVAAATESGAPTFLQQASLRAFNLTQSIYGRIAAAVASGGASAKGRVFNEIGAEAENIYGDVLSEVAPAGTEIETGVDVGTRVLDRLATAPNGLKAYLG